jgi:hypothetical protein
MSGFVDWKRPVSREMPISGGFFPNHRQNLLHQWNRFK